MLQVSDEVRAICEDPVLLRRGHFELASRKHSDLYWEKFRLLEQPEMLAALCRPIVQRFSDIEIDLIIGPTLGGVVMGYEVARQMGKKVVFAERASDSDKRVFRQPCILRSDDRVLIVDDVLMTGGTLDRVIKATLDIGASICGIGIILDRSTTTPEYPFPLSAVHRMVIPDYEPEDCPLCKDDVPLHHAAGTI